MIKIILPLVLIVLVGMAWLVNAKRPAAVNYDHVPVQQGRVSDMLRETGVVQPRDSTLVKTRLKGTIEWLIEDGSWVEEGERVFVINADDAMREVTESRSELLNNQQELSLARMRRRHAEQVEQQRIKSAKRALEYATIRYRIISALPQGGRRLIDLHEKLVLREEETSAVRDAYEQAQDTYQKAQDAYLEQLDRWQAHKDAMVRAQAKIDELVVRTESKVDETKPSQVEAHERDKQQLAEAQNKLERMKTQLPELESQRNQARVERDAARLPRDELADKLNQREATDKELYVQLEIEKRGVDLAKLQIDLQVAQLTLAENKKKAKEGQAAFASGAISQIELEQLEIAVESSTKDLAIWDQKILLASRAAPPEVLEEARLKMNQTEQRARTAQDVRDRRLNLLDKQVELLRAKMDANSIEIKRLTNDFEPVIEFSINFLRKEHEGLDETETDRRTEIEAELAGLEQRLKYVRANPPNVGKSPTEGIIRVIRKWGRAYHAGDRVDSRAILMEIFPPRNLEVRTALNETTVQQVNEGMAVHIMVPALGDEHLKGVVTLVARVGKDKHAERGNRDNLAFAGVTQFEARIHLEEVPEAIRPGMTAVVEIELNQQDDVLYLPRRAVRIINGTGVVLIGTPRTTRERGTPHERKIQGHVYADDVFIIESGLGPDDTVLIERKKSH